jgi:hypothetical protein
MDQRCPYDVVRNGSRHTRETIDQARIDFEQQFEHLDYTLEEKYARALFKIHALSKWIQEGHRIQTPKQTYTSVAERVKNRCRGR